MRFLYRRIYLVGLGLAVVGGCAGGNQRIELSGAAILAEPDPELNLSAYDAEELFHLAGEAERTNDPNLATAAYRRLLSDFPTSPLRWASLFNLGLLYEAAERYGDAAPLYEEIATADTPTGDTQKRTWTDAHFRLAVCFGKLNRWWNAVAVFDYLLAESWMDGDDRLESLVGRAIALHEAGDAESAEVAYATALRFFRDAQKEMPLYRTPVLAEAAFRMGDIAAERYHAVALDFPIDLLRERLTTKCEHLLTAQYRYLRALRYGDAHTVAAAGYRIGELYETLYDAVVGLRAPDDLTSEQAEVYHEEVRERVRVLVEKALMAYEKGLFAGQRAPSAAAWTAKLEEASARLRSLYLAEEK